MNGHLWRYVLLVIDVFSHFLWLRPLESKSSQVIAIELECIYMEYGSPEIIQCDQGGEFKKALKLLCDRMNIKLIYSRSRHNQSQGNVERYYRALRSKMEYDLQKIGQDGVKRASLKWANAWLKVRVDGLDWYIIIRIFWKKNWQQLMINWHDTVDVIVRVKVASSDVPF